MRKIITLLLIIIMPGILLAGGGWTQSKGNGFYKLGQSVIIGNNYFAPDGSVIDIRTISLYTTSFYGEYGISDRFTGIVYFPFFVRSTLNEEQTASGTLIEEGDQVNSIGDTDISIKYGWTKNKKIALATTLTFGLPFGNNAGGETGILQTGDGEFNQMITVDAGAGLGLGFYSNISAAFNHRTKGFSDEFRYGLEAGWSNGNLTGLIRFYGIKPLGEEGEINPDQPNSVFGNRIEYLSFTPEVLYKFTDKIGLSLSAGFATYGKRILANPNLSAGIFMQL